MTLIAIALWALGLPMFWQHVDDLRPLAPFGVKAFCTVIWPAVMALYLLTTMCASLGFGWAKRLLDE